MTFNRSDNNTFSGNIAGAGYLRQIGSGTTTLTGDAKWLIGTHEIEDGRLLANSILGGKVDVIGGTLGGNGIVGPTMLQAGGTIAPGNSIGNLTIDGRLDGYGGLIEIEAVLGDDNSATDLLTINGGTTGTANVKVINTGGSGAATTNGIKIIDVYGLSLGNFSLLGDYVFNGEQAVVAGAYAYRLYKGGINTPTDGDWYLRSVEDPNRVTPPNTDPGTGTPPNGGTDPVVPPDGGTGTPAQPLPPLYQPGVPIYEAYPQALLGLNGLNTLQQRVGNRNWTQGAHSDDHYGLGGPQRNGA